MKNYFNDCIDCKERYMGCHSKCEKYKKARVEKDKDNLNIRKSKEPDISFNSFRDIFFYVLRDYNQDIENDHRKK